MEDNLAIMTTDATDTVSFALATKKIHNDNGAENSDYRCHSRVLRVGVVE